jgi:hypothetical protein
MGLGKRPPRLKEWEHSDEEGNVVGPGYAIDSDGDILSFTSPSAMGYGPKTDNQPAPLRSRGPFLARLRRAGRQLLSG